MSTVETKQTRAASARPAAEGAARPGEPGRLPRGLLPRVMVVVALVMVVGGVVQLASPATVLRGMGIADVGAALRLTTSVGGALVAVLGAVTLHALLTGSRWPPLFLWLGIEKLVYASLTASGVVQSVFATSTWGMVTYDALCGVAALVYWSRLRRLG